MPIWVGKIHGMARPTAKNTHATTIGALRRLSMSAIGPATRDATMDTIMVITEMTWMDAAADSLS